MWVSEMYLKYCEREARGRGGGRNLKVWTVPDVEWDTIRYPGYDNFIHGTECFPLPVGGVGGIYDLNPKFLYLSSS